MTLRYESVARITATPTELFAYLDDPAHLSAHMDRPSWMMAGGSMHLSLDAAQGKAPGFPRSNRRMAIRSLAWPAMTMSFGAADAKCCRT